MSITMRTLCHCRIEEFSHPLETDAKCLTRRMSLLFTLLILHVLWMFDNRLLVTEWRVPTKVTKGRYDLPYRLLVHAF
jgi:hypothetical protein